MSILIHHSQFPRDLFILANEKKWSYLIYIKWRMVASNLSLLFIPPFQSSTSHLVELKPLNPLSLSLSPIQSNLLLFILLFGSLWISMNGRSSGASRLSRCMKAPIRMLCRACDFYVRRMNSCAGRMPQGGALGYTMTTTLPRSFSVQSGRTSMSGDDDLQELIRANSVSRTGGGRFDLKGASPQQPAVVPRSQSVAIGRIDEDKPCDFDDDVKLGSDFLFPRSRSYAVAPRRRVAAFV